MEKLRGLQAAASTSTQGLWRDRGSSRYRFTDGVRSNVPLAPLLHKRAVMAPAASHLHDLHVQQPQEAATKAETHGGRHLRLKLERRVIQLQLLKRLTKALKTTARQVVAVAMTA